jgi:hypothetical protein
MNHKRRLFIAIAMVALLAFMASALPAAAATALLSNLSDTGASAGTSILSTFHKAVIFQTPAGAGYDFQSVTFFLAKNAPTDPDPAHLRIAIYSVDGSNNPLIELYGWNVDQTLTNTPSDYIFTPPTSQSFQGSTSYALVLKGRDNTNTAMWYMGNPASAPTGAATWIAYRFSTDGGATWISSGIYNRFELVGNQPPTAIHLQTAEAHPASVPGWVWIGLGALGLAVVAGGGFAFGRRLKENQ